MVLCRDQLACCPPILRSHSLRGDSDDARRYSLQQDPSDPPTSADVLATRIGRALLVRPSHWPGTSASTSTHGPIIVSVCSVLPGSVTKFCAVQLQRGGPGIPFRLPTGMLSAVQHRSATSTELCQARCPVLNFVTALFLSFFLLGLVHRTLSVLVSR